MATSIQIPIDEYLNTSYRPDREYVDGELLERNGGKNEHSRLQALLAGWFGPFEDEWGVAVFIEQRLQVSATRIRIPDVLLVPLAPHPDVLIDPPILVIEVLSPDDSYTETQKRAGDYFAMGVGTVWIVDPVNRTGRSCVGKAWIESETLQVTGTPIWVNLREMFDRLDARWPGSAGGSTQGQDWRGGPDVRYESKSGKLYWKRKEKQVLRLRCAPLKMTPL